ncbi:MAG: class 1 fructose-bisphosphatase [Hyphomicrobiaceae bacterium]
MHQHITLETYLAGWARTEPLRSEAASVVLAIARTCTTIASTIARGDLAGELSTVVGGSAGGDEQKMLDVWANDQLMEALAEAGVAAIASEELDAPTWLQGDSCIAVALDPLDGSSNIATNAPTGTIFSILPVSGPATFLQPGTRQIAGGYAIYGPQCAFVLTVGKGTLVFALDPDTRQFRLTGRCITVTQASHEYAINASNYRHWSHEIRSYIDDCLAGAEGARGADLNMRWIGSLVAECHRILARGGVYLYPGDRRRGYENGRLRLVYEANPIAFLIEQAGGKASDGQTRILDLVPTHIHQRTPLIFGSAEEVDRTARYKGDAGTTFERSPLFASRSLLRT